MNDAELERIHNAGLDELERMLAHAEEEIKALRAEIALRRQEQRHLQMQALPEDLSQLEGGWLNLVKVVRTIMSER
ncbi:hypothetical protein [Corynebacterium freiburgense]|uniref:hypothetical protein n=1 Tax=Corynebacterium freiburgense TaxID=556548 RepID=UPI00042148B4|nr:hypothetical protein [Corynebacterium freiburgense]WJZ03734.1 hypothetical protein CFREI_12385 [Corynebacterium freiburgense]